MQKLAIAAILTLTGGPALAADHRGEQHELPATYANMLHCRSIADRDARLACFDEAAAKLDAATKSRDIVVVDREQIAKTRRTLFGLPIPRIDIFSGGKGTEGDGDIDHIESVIVSAGENGNGGWTFRLQDGSVWTQTDDKPLALAPRSGQKAVVRSGAMGSFMMQVNGQPGVKVRRLS